MIDVLPRSHAAIFNTPERRIPPSLFLGIGFAVTVHGLLAFYLLSQTFTQPLVEEVYPTAPPTILTMERLETKPVVDPKPQKPVVKAHTVDDIPVTVDTTPIIPVRGPDIAIAGPVELPLTPVEPAPADASGTQAGPAYVNARWTRFPDAATLGAYYPEAAVDADVGGTVVVECIVQNAAGNVACTVISETPKRYGFGKATVAMIGAVGRVDTTQGDVKPGSVLRKSVTWTLAD